MKLTDYISGDRRGRGAHDLEMQALRDPFLAEALDGLEQHGEEFAAVSADLHRRIARRAQRTVLRRRYRRAATAAAACLAVAAALFAWRYAPQEVTPPEAPPVLAENLRRETPADSLRKVVPETPVASRPTPPRPSRPIAVESGEPETSDPEDEGSFDDPVEPDTWDEAAANKDDFDNVVITAYGSGHSSQTTGSIHIRGTRNPAPEAPEKDAFSHSATPAKFRNGGIVEFRKWVQRRVRKPQKPLPDKASGRVVVSFVVDTLGRVTQIELLRVPDQALADEPVRVLRRAPRWKPARQGDRPVPMKFVTPVDFQ